MFSQLIFWTWFAGLVCLIIGCIVARKEFSAARGLDKLIVLGPILYAAPLAAFGAEHLATPQFVVGAVPPWMPAHLFWAYFVGAAEVVAALSIILRKQVRLSAMLLGVMFFLFVVMIHVPGVIAKPGNRIPWAIALRDLSFAGGAWALAATQFKGSNWLKLIARLCIAIPLVVFAVEHFLHPQFVPGVPLSKLIPPWMPFGPLWGYLTGAVLLVSGIAMLINRHVRTAAAWLGLLIVFLVVFLYLPILAVAAQPTGTMGARLEAINYVFDTLFFGGAILLLAAASPRAGLLRP